MGKRELYDKAFYETNKKDLMPAASVAARVGRMPKRCGQ